MSPVKVPHLRFDFLRRLYTGRPAALTATVGVLAATLFAVAGFAAWFSYDLVSGLPNRQTIRGIGDMAQATTIYDNGDRPVFTIFKEQRIEVPLNRISQNLIKAVISVEDQRFFEHSGIDAVRIGGSILKNIQAGRRAEGASTITQQLARQSFLTRGKTYRRKLTEVIIAAYIEKQYSKEEILELYLNKVYFGGGLYGVEAAARGYFGKSAADVTVDEAALLAGLIQSPSSYAPTVNMDRAIARRNIVLATMVGSGAITRDVADRAKAAPVTLVNGLEVKENFGLYFKEEVRKELVERFGWQRVYQGGLKVYTTIDSNMQQLAERAVEDGLEAIEKRRAYKHPVRGDMKVAEDSTPGYVQGALLALDPSTGSVLAMVGGRDFNESHFNRATQAHRQSGSAFKPFVYAAAIEAGYSPASVITNLNAPTATAQGAWVPEDEHSDADFMTLRTALRTSSNRAAVQLLNAVGIPKAVSYAQKMNVGTPPSVPSLALGASDVTLAALTAAYGAFANGGMVRQPQFIRRVEDADGTVLYQGADDAHRAISESTAFLMASMLADVVNAGTAYKARQVGFTLPAAGKTGTTNDYNDAWFVGFTPHLVAGVWVGFDKPQTITAGGYAADLAVPIWGTFMKGATKGARADWLDRPADVVAVNVCRVSGKLPNGGCDTVEVVSKDGMLERQSMVYTDYFRKGAAPTELCPLHPNVSFLDRFAGMFGKDSTPRVTSDEAGLPTPPTASTSGESTPHPSPAASADASSASRDEAAPPKKKRGFWGRLFGGGDKGDKNDDKKDDRASAPDAQKKADPRRQDPR